MLEVKPLNEGSDMLTEHMMKQKAAIKALMEPFAAQTFEPGGATMRKLLKVRAASCNTSIEEMEVSSECLAEADCLTSYAQSDSEHTLQGFTQKVFHTDL